MVLALFLFSLFWFLFHSILFFLLNLPSPPFLSSPSTGDIIPFRVFLGEFGLVPSYEDVLKKISVDYLLRVKILCRSGVSYQKQGFVFGFFFVFSFLFLLFLTPSVGQFIYGGRKTEANEAE